MGETIIGAPRVVDPNGGVAIERRPSALEGLQVPLPRAPQTTQNDTYSLGGKPAPRGTVPTPIHPPPGPREVTPEESRRYLEAIRRGQHDPDRWRTTRSITEGLRNGAITQDQLDSAIREGEGALARKFLDQFGRGGEVGEDGQRFIDKGLERGDITSEQMKRATEDRESFQTLESLRRGNGRIEAGSEPTDHAAIRRGIERGLFSRNDVDAANREGEQRKRDAMM